MGKTYRKNKQLDYIDFDYGDINTKLGLLNYASKTLKLRGNSNIHHLWAKDIVMNSIYSISDLNNTEKIVLIYLYDLNSHQDVSPYIEVNNREISKALGINEGEISKIINKFEDYNLIFKTRDMLDNKVIGFNENVITWGVAIDSEQESIIERTRKRHASNNIEIHDLLEREGVK